MQIIINDSKFPLVYIKINPPGKGRCKKHEVASKGSEGQPWGNENLWN